MSALSSAAIANLLRSWNHCWPAPWLEKAVADAADRLDAQAAEIERLTRERDACLTACSAYRRMEAAEAEAARLQERIDAACELAESLYHNPEGTLWNHGTTSTLRDRVEWKGIKDTAQDMLAVLDPERARTALPSKE